MKVSKYTPEQLKEILIRKVSSQKPHALQAMSVAYSKRMVCYVTGEGQEDYLISLSKSETKGQQKQRVSLTNTRTKHVYNKINNELCKINTGDQANFELIIDEGNRDAKEEKKKVLSKLNRFDNGDSVELYAQERIKKLNFIDPNSWIVVKQTNHTDKEKTYSYPSEVASANVFDFEKSLGCTQYMISHHVEQVNLFEMKNDAGYLLASEVAKVALHERYINVKGAKANQTSEPKYASKGREVYFMHAAGVTYRLREIFKGEPLDPREEKANVVFNGKSQNFYITAYDTKIDMCPAFQVGYIKSDCVKGFYVSILDKVDKDLDQLIFRQSEYNLMVALHGFLQKFVYAPKCNHTRTFKQECRCEDPKECSDCNGKRSYQSISEHCAGGNYSSSGDKCTKCKGHGKDIHSTVQDIVVIRVPENQNEEIIPIDKWVHYVQVPIDQLKHEKECLKELEADIVNCTLSSDIVSSSEIRVQETATGKLLDRQGLQGVMIELGNQISKFIMFASESQAAYLGINNIKALHQYSKNPQVHSLSEMLDQSAKAVASGAPQEIISKIHQQIMLMQCNGDQDFITEYLSWNKWKPFSDKTESERLSALAMMDEDGPIRILYTFFERIRCEILIDIAPKKFSEIPYEDQKAILDEKVAAYKAEYFPEDDEVVSGLGNREETEETSFEGVS